MSKLNRKMNKNLLEISDNLKEIMFNYNWPGNIRELEHFIENIMVRTEESETYLKEENIPLYIKELLSDDIKHDNEEVVLNYDLQEKLDNLERNSIITTLNKNMWNVSKSAKQLGVTRQSLIYRMKKLEINRL
jgi:arginine utilization regulatory protein